MQVHLDTRLDLNSHQAMANGNSVCPTIDEEHAQTPRPASESGDDVEKTSDSAIETVSPRKVHGFKWFLAVVSVMTSTFLFALDNTIVADVQPAIVKTFGQVDKLPWLSVAFLVSAIGTNLFWSVIFIHTASDSS